MSRGFVKSHIKSISAQKKFIIILTPILLSFTLLNYALYYKKINMLYVDKLVKINRTQVERISKEYDSTINIANFSALFMSYQNKEFIALATSFENNYDCKSKLMNYIMELLASNKYFTSVYLYLPADDLVLTSNLGAISYSDFYDYYPIEEKKNSPKTNLILTSNRIIPFLFQDQYIFSIVASVPLFEDSDIQLVINVSSNKILYDVLKQHTLDESTRLSVVANDGAVLWGTGEEHIFKNTSIVKNGTIITELTESKSGNSFKLASPALPNKGQNTTGYLIFTISALSLLLLILILVSAKIYGPLRAMLEKIKFELASTATTGEFEMLGLYIGNINKENQDLKLRVEEMFPFYKNKLFSQIITTYNYNLNELVEKLRYLNININFENYVVITIKPCFKGLSEHGKNCFLLETVTIIDRHLENGKLGFYAETQKDLISIALNTGNIHVEAERLDYVNDFAKSLHKEILSLTRVETMIGIGSFVKSVRNLCKSYEETLTALNYNAILSIPVLNICQVYNNQKNTFDYPYEKERAIVRFVSLGLYKESMEALSDFFHSIVRSDLKSAEVIFVSLQLIGALNKIIYDNKLKLESKLFYISSDILHEINDINAIKGKIRLLIEQIVEAIEKQCKSTNIDLGKEIISFIESHYTEDIQMVDLTEYFNMDRFLIGRILKEHTGLTFNDYINRLRISYAKKLLDTSDKSIKEIAEYAGFNYSYYFSRVFKKYEHISPVAYREKCRG